MSRSLLPRTYWCHADYHGQGPACAMPLSITTTAPAQAVEWMRDTARNTVFVLDREAFASVWHWLGDHRAVDAAVIELRRGYAYTYTVPTPTGYWTWTAYPVSVLPMAQRCGAAGCESAPRGVTPESVRAPSGSSTPLCSTAVRRVV